MSMLAGLDAHARRLASTSIADLIDRDPARAGDFAVRSGPLYANFSRQRYDRKALDALFAIAGQADLGGAVRRLLDGAIVNPTEGRAAEHRDAERHSQDQPLHQSGAVRVRRPAPARHRPGPVLVRRQHHVGLHRLPRKGKAVLPGRLHDADGRHPPELRARRERAELQLEPTARDRAHARRFGAAAGATRGGRARRGSGAPGRQACSGYGLLPSMPYSLLALATSLAVSLPSAASAATAAWATWLRSTSKCRRRLARVSLRP